MSHAFESVETAWSSLSEKDKNEIRLAFENPEMRIVRPFPLGFGETNRVGRLRGYGNAIVAPLATQFIETVMDWLD